MCGPCTPADAAIVREPYREHRRSRVWRPQFEGMAREASYPLALADGVGALPHVHDSPLDDDHLLTPGDLLREIEEQPRGDDGVTPLRYCGPYDGAWRDTATNLYWFDGPHNGLRWRGMQGYHFHRTRG